MRFLVDVLIPNEPFNTLVLNGTAGATIEKILGAIKPEAVYFTERHGQRGCTMVVELAKASDIPSIAEPFFLALDAEVQLHPTMTPEDLAQGGLDKIGATWK
ncbi:MAG: panthothenate synthetase [bacterium]